MNYDATVVIPSYQHGRVVCDAVDSVLNQTRRCEVVVVDDGSTDDTLERLAKYGDRVRIVRQEHLGPSAARNAGAAAATAEYLMYLDADDVIDPHKVATQIRAMTSDVGWVLCDVWIEDEVRGTRRKASEQYDYGGRDLGGWIAPQLERANFIPIMSPLVRTSIAASVKFDDTKVPEDWYYWKQIAELARVRYVPEALATYRHGKTGRSRTPKVARGVCPNPVPPLRLNLGCGSPGTRSWHPLDGLVNLDKSMGWMFEQGLSEFRDGSVYGITVSHSLMYVAERDWPFVFREFARVLAPGGVIRITEDDATNPASSRRGGWKGSEPAVSLTNAAKVKEALKGAGLRAYDSTPDVSRYRDGSLRQSFHGPEPHVFYVEGVKDVRLLLSPHNDDEALFASFTIIRERPHVVVCYRGSAGYGDARVREEESRAACGILGASGFEQWDCARESLVAKLRAYDEQARPVVVYAPSMLTSHPEHRKVAEAAALVFGMRVQSYHTYDLATGDSRWVEEGQTLRKVIGRRVPFEPEWLGTKMRALAQYGTQLAHPRASQFFAMDLLEYLA